MKLISVNVGLPRPVPYQDGIVSTGIYKESVAGPVWVRRLNLDGDGQADLKVHGGEHKAVYAYPLEHYAFWSRELGRNDLGYGQFGENLTVEGLLEEQVNIGDVYRIGKALLQVSQPRAPCFKLGIRMGDARFPARFPAANRTGFYLRVLEEGRVAAGDAIMLAERSGNPVSVSDVFRCDTVPAARVRSMNAPRASRRLHRAGARHSRNIFGNGPSQLERELDTRTGGQHQLTKTLLYPFQRRRIISLEAEHQHRRGVGGAYQAEAVGEVRAHAVNRRHPGVRERCPRREFLDERVVLTLGQFQMQLGRVHGIGQRGEYLARRAWVARQQF